MKPGKAGLKTGVWIFHCIKRYHFGKGNAGFAGIFYKLNVFRLRTVNYKTINRALGNMDLFLMDQLLKGRLKKEFRILDAGCGEGRNLKYFISNGFNIYGIDRHPGAIQMLRYSANTWNKQFNTEKFQVGDIRSLPYENDSFDFVICIGVLHFSDDLEDYLRMMSEMVRVTKSGKSLFIRMDSSEGLKGAYPEIDGGKKVLQDGTIRFLAGRRLLEDTLKRFDLEWVEPLRILIENGKPGVSVQLMKKRR